MDENDLYFKPPTYTNTCSDDSCSFPSFPWFPENVRRRKSRLGTHRHQGRVFQDVPVDDGNHSSSNKENIFEQFSSDTSPSIPAPISQNDELKSTMSSIFDSDLRASPFSFVMGKHHDQKSPVLSIQQTFDDDKISPIITSLEKSRRVMSPFLSCFTEDEIGGILKEINSPGNEGTPPFSLSSSSEIRTAEPKQRKSFDRSVLSNLSASVNDLQTFETTSEKLIPNELPIEFSSVSAVKDINSDIGNTIELLNSLSSGQAEEDFRHENPSVLNSNSSYPQAGEYVGLSLDNLNKLPRNSLSIQAEEDIDLGRENLRKLPHNSSVVQTEDVDLNCENSEKLPHNLSSIQAFKEVNSSPKMLINDEQRNELLLTCNVPDLPAVMKVPAALSLILVQNNDAKIEPSVEFGSKVEENITAEVNQLAVPPVDNLVIQTLVTPKPEVHFAEPPVAREFAVPRNASKIPILISVKGKLYKVLNVLGTGGSSVVYQVSHPETNELLAVKKVELPEHDDDITEGYLNEVQMLESLQNCDVIIKIFDHQLVYKNGKKTLYVIMEKGDTDLSSLIRSVNESKKLSIPMIIYYWTEMLAAVNEVHRRGIIHSDLKPANFVLVRGRLKLIDFGIASSIQGDMTSVYKDSFCGTLNYMSPEAINYVRCPSGMAGYKITFKTDVWSLGCILYNLVYGRLPFHHIKKRMEKMHAIVSSSVNVEFPEKRDIPPILMSSLKLSLEKNYQHRPTVQELLDRTLRIFQCSNVD